MDELALALKSHRVIELDHPCTFLGGSNEASCGVDSHCCDFSRLNQSLRFCGYILNDEVGSSLVHDFIVQRLGMFKLKLWSFYDGFRGFRCRDEWKITLDGVLLETMM